jgi:cytochrome P450
VPPLSSEATHVFAQELGTISDWKQFNAMALSSALVHYISNCILVGPELCRRPDYRHATESLNISHVIFGALWNFAPLGPFRKPFYWVFSIPYRMQIRRALKKHIVPVVEDRMANKDNPDFARNLDTIQLMVERPPAEPRETDAFRHAVRILHLHSASTGSSITLVHNILWQLMQMPECIGPIQTEIKDVKAKYGSWDSKHMLNHLHLLDSFIREVLRVHVPSARKCSFDWRTMYANNCVVVSFRVAQQPVTFHDNLQLKQGTRIVFPTRSIHRDPSNYAHPLTFQPWRFAGSGTCTSKQRPSTRRTCRSGKASKRALAASSRSKS